MNRRQLLRTLGGLAVTAPFATLLPRVARATEGVAERVIFFYFPDGVAGPSQNGEPSLWHPTGTEFDFQLPNQLEPLQPWADQCVFFSGLSMGGTDSGSHPGGAKKLLTAKDGGMGESIDHYLSRTAGASSPWRHLYLGAMANVNNASGDKHIVYPTAGQSLPPNDDPASAFDLLFGSFTPAPGGGTEQAPPDAKEVSVIDGVLADMNSMRARLGSTETAKLDLHLEALRDVERRVKQTGPALPDTASCNEPSLAYSQGDLYDPSRFPEILRAQIDLMVLAMSCGRTRVGTIQCSHHTSELIMSRFPGTEMYDPNYDMRSHQASHYGAAHDWNHREFSDFVKQRRYWVSQLAYLLQRLSDTPEGDGSMLDHSLVVLCTEVCDGNTHLHDNMPFVLAGGANGAISTGRYLDVGYRRHGDLLASVAHAMGEYVGGWGDGSSGTLPGLN